MEEARGIVRKHFKIELDPSELVPSTESSRYSELFNSENRTKTWFGVIFFSALVLPYCAIYTFLPTILADLDIEDADLQYLILNIFLLIGGIAGIWFVAKMPRRSFTIWSFLILAVSLVALGTLSDMPVAVLMIPFVVYTFVMSAASNITQVCPPELFPTQLRASGVGLLNGLSRIASAVGTFALPVSLANLGVPTTMYLLTGVLLLGMVATVPWAPETRSKNLT
ncbi:putative MFS family arabinose efflux permease [Rhodococcus sp. BE178]